MSAGPFRLERDGKRWIAEIESIPGCLAYGETPEEAVRAVTILGFSVLADRIEHLEAALSGPEPSANAQALAFREQVKAAREQRQPGLARAGRRA